MWHFLIDQSQVSCYPRCFGALIWPLERPRWQLIPRNWGTQLYDGFWFFESVEVVAAEQEPKDSPCSQGLETGKTHCQICLHIKATLSHRNIEFLWVPILRNRGCKSRVWVQVAFNCRHWVIVRHYKLTTNYFQDSPRTTNQNGPCLIGDLLILVVRWVAKWRM